MTPHRPLLPHVLLPQLLPVAVALALATLGACGKATEQAYTIALIGPPGVNPFASAVRATLELNGQSLADVSLKPGQPFDLNAGDIDTKKIPVGRLIVRGIGPQGETVAYGETPEMELAARPLNLRIFIQAPGTFGRTVDLAGPMKAHVAMTAVAAARTDLDQLRAFSAPIFGTGRLYVPSDKSVPEPPTNLLYLYNPVIHTPVLAGTTADQTGAPLYRYGASAWAAADGTALIFGGIGRRGTAPETTALSQLDLFHLVRSSGLLVAKDSGRATRPNDKTLEDRTLERRIARAGAVMSEAKFVYAIGGFDSSGTALDSIVEINLSLPDATLTLSDAKMASARTGHTATAVLHEGSAEILIFGGATRGGISAEVFAPTGAPALIPVGTAANRRGHAALTLPAAPGQAAGVLIIGGQDDDGKPLASTLLYSPADRSLSAGPFTLQTPRTGFAAFIVGNDLVVAGGTDATGALIGDAEIYDVRTPAVPFVRRTPAFPRTGAGVALMSNHSVLIMGGETELGYGSAVEEIYQPRQN